MADLDQQQLREWALRGAEQRLLEIAKEAAAIRHVFPELRGLGNGIPTDGTRGSTATSRARRAGRGRPTMSAAARRRISEAQKARWAKQRGDTPATSVPEGGARKHTDRRGRPKMSAAARKRISEAQKARWAAQKAKQATSGGTSTESSAAGTARRKKK